MIDLPTPQLKVTPLRAGYPADGGDLDLLVTVGVDLPSEQVDREPIALALVLDRSGSMGGSPLEAAKAAARAAIEMLLPSDWVSVVAYDDQVTVVAPLALAGPAKDALLRSVASITPGGSTALFAGWAEGLSQAMACPDQRAAARVVLLSDGMANVGISDAPTIAADVALSASHGVTTTAMGFGRSYDEDLLRAMADAGQGNYVFIEGEAQVTEAFQHELAGLSALRGRNARLEPSAGVRLVGNGSHLPPCGTGVRVPDLVGGLQRELVVSAVFEPGAKDPKVALVWDDMITSKSERLEVALGIEPLSREALDRLVADSDVATYVALSRIAEAKLRLAAAMRSGQTEEAAKLLEQIATEVDALPDGDRKAEESQGLNRLRDLARRNQAHLAARFSEKFARDTLRGSSDVKRNVQFAMERDLYQKKMAAVQGIAEVLRGHNASVAAGRGQAAPARRAGSTSQMVAERTLRGASGPVSVAVVLGDITDQAVDVLVNSTNRHLFGNAGVDGAVHRRGGPELTQAARQIGSLELGRAAFTPGFALPARWVVHTVAKPWADGNSGELEVLQSAYGSAYSLAAQLSARTLAVTALGTGTYQVPADLAARVAIDALRGALQQPTSFSQVRFVTLDPAVAEAFARAIGEDQAPGATLPN